MWIHPELPRAVFFVPNISHNYILGIGIKISRSIGKLLQGKNVDVVMADHIMLFISFISR